MNWFSTYKSWFNVLIPISFYLLLQQIFEDGLLCNEKKTLINVAINDNKFKCLVEKVSKKCSKKCYWAELILKMLLSVYQNILPERSVRAFTTGFKKYCNLIIRIEKHSTDHKILCKSSFCDKTVIYWIVLCDKFYSESIQNLFIHQIMIDWETIAFII